jgi:hypothetical protein
LFRVTGVARNLVWGCSWNFFSKIYPKILSFCAVKAKTEFYLVKNSQGFRGANAPLHPLWLRYCLGSSIIYVTVTEGRGHGFFEDSNKALAIKSLTLVRGFKIQFSSEFFYMIAILDKVFISNEKLSPKMQNAKLYLYLPGDSNLIQNTCLLLTKTRVMNYSSKEKWKLKTLTFPW